MVYKWISSAVLVVLIMSSLGWVFYSENIPYLEGMQDAASATADAATADTATAGVFNYIDASMNEMLQTTGWKSTDMVMLNKPNASEAVGIGGASESGGNAFSGNKTSNKMYNSDNFDITYHPEPVAEDVWKLDANGKLIKVPYYEIKNKTWYSVGKYPAIYVPNYEESVRLSQG